MTLKDYTIRDRDAILSRSLRVLQTVYPSWTSTDYASAGNGMLHAMSRGLADAHFAIDIARRQSRLATTTNRDVALIHARSLGYPVQANSAAEATLTVVLGSALLDDLEIAPGDLSFSTKDDSPLTFEVKEAVTVPTGATTFTLRVENARLVSETISVPESIPDYKPRLTYSPYIQDSMVVSVNAVNFEVRDTLALAQENEAVVRLDLIQNDRVRLVFGAGPNGAQVPAGTLVATYKVGGGAVGTTEANTITSPSTSTLTDNSGNPVTITSVTNTEKSEGGGRADSIEEIQRKAPRSRMTADKRAINEVDFVNHTESIPGVLRAYAVTHKTSNLSPNKTELLVIPKGGGTASPDLITRVKNRFGTTFLPSVLINLTVRASNVSTANIQATVNLRDNVTEAAARASIVAKLETYFDPDKSKSDAIKFGAELINAGQDAIISYYDLLCEVRNDPHVHSISKTGDDVNFRVNSSNVDISLDADQFPLLGTITLINAETGLPF